MPHLTTHGNEFGWIPTSRTQTFKHYFELNWNSASKTTSRGDLNDSPVDRYMPTGGN